MPMKSVSEIMAVVDVYAADYYVLQGGQTQADRRTWIEAAIIECHMGENARKGAAVKSELKARTARANGMKGGRPRRKTGKRTI